MALTSKTFWEELEKILMEQGISLNELATMSGLQYSGLVKIRDGKTRFVRNATVREVANYELR